MLKTKVIEKIRPSKKVQELFNSNQLNYTSVNGYIQIIERTNIKQVFPVIYKLDTLTIYEFPKEYAKKPYYVVEHNIACDFKELINFIYNIHCKNLSLVQF